MTIDALEKLCARIEELEDAIGAISALPPSQIAAPLAKLNSNNQLRRESAFGRLVAHVHSSEVGRHEITWEAVVGPLLPADPPVAGGPEDPEP